jgi:hypothetical protein
MSMADPWGEYRINVERLGSLDDRVIMAFVLMQNSGFQITAEALAALLGESKGDIAAALHRIDERGILEAKLVDGD